MWKKKKMKRTIKYEKKIVICNIEIVDYEDGTVKCEEKVRELPNMRKELSYMMLELHNVMMKSSSVRKK